MDNNKIKEIVRKIRTGSDKKDPKKELKELQKAHDLLIDGIVYLNRLNSTFSSNLTKDQHTELHSHIKKLTLETEKIKEFINNLKL